MRTRASFIPLLAGIEPQLTNVMPRPVVGSL